MSAPEIPELGSPKVAVKCRNSNNFDGGESKEDHTKIPVMGSPKVACDLQSNGSFNGGNIKSSSNGHPTKNLKGKSSSLSFESGVGEPSKTASSQSGAQIDKSKETAKSKGRANRSGKKASGLADKSRYNLRSRSRR